MSPPAADGSVRALTVIAFIGSVFSPYYAAARRRHGDDMTPAQAHCAVNVALCHCSADGRVRRRWCMTERDQHALQRSADTLRIGPSRLHWMPQGDLVIDLDEWSVPWPRRLHGRIRLTPGALPARAFALDAAARHGWQPISPAARVSVDLDGPDGPWQGDAYLDCNAGERPLAADFAHWDWARARLPGGCSAVRFDLQAREAPARHLALGFSADGSTHAHAPLPVQALRPSAWRLPRQAHADAGHVPQGRAMLEDGPFYWRALVTSRWAGEPVLAMQEHLDLNRLDARWVQALLPFRMPRRPSIGRRHM